MESTGSPQACEQPPQPDKETRRSKTASTIEFLLLAAFTIFFILWIHVGVPFLLTRLQFPPEAVVTWQKIIDFGSPSLPGPIGATIASAGVGAWSVSACASSKERVGDAAPKQNLHGGAPVAGKCDSCVLFPG
jgi:hypothetical protein